MPTHPMDKTPSCDTTKPGLWTIWSGLWTVTLTGLYEMGAA